MAQQKKLSVTYMAVIGVIVLLIVIVTVAFFLNKDQKVPTSFEECKARSDAKILETYPEQCVVDGKTFTGPENQLQGM